MKVRSFFLLVCISFTFVSTLIGQRFPCDGQILIATNVGTYTYIAKPVYIPFSSPFLSPFIRFSGSFDALGFNSKDNYIYGVQVNTNNIVKCKSDNSFEVIGSVSIVDTLKSNAGDCSPDGLYMCHDYKLNQILVFNVVEGFKLLHRINLFWDPKSVNQGAFTTRIFDFAFDPKNPTIAYAYQGTSDHPSLAPPSTSGNILQINLALKDPNLGMVTPLKAISQNKVSHLGALIFSPKSDLYGFGTASDGLNPLQNTLFSIDAFSGNASPILASNPASTYSDGCSCPYSFTFSNSVPSDGIFCNNDEKTFVLKIDNNSSIPVENVILIDTFLQGMIISDISNTFIGNIAAGTGLGTNILEITGLQIPAKTVVEIKIKIKTIDAKVGYSDNQAFLKNLPERYNGVMRSDNLATPGAENDPSVFIVIARKLQDVSWKIIPPSDCITANDGQIILSSKQFMPGQQYEIGLRNKIGWAETFARATIDQNNSLTVDSLFPGDYQVFSLRTLADNCSVALQDTTIILQAPNDLLKLQVTSNSPICEGESLILASSFSPAGYIHWEGPKIFSTDSPNPLLDYTSKDQSGEYKATVKYGYCTQTANVEVDIKAKIKASITGNAEYCAREKLLLRAVGEGKGLAYKWIKPNHEVTLDSTLLIQHLGNDDTGSYQLVAMNGACSDTADMDVMVLPTPTLSLPDIIMTDFCAPVILSPEILGDTDVSYHWTPQLGLSCDDCPNPQIQTLVQSSYTLKIMNEFFCTDSATVEISLDKEKIIFAPNIFNMASTSGNDHFVITPGCVTQLIHSLDIYDRWGNTVFSSRAYTVDGSLGFWDGYTQGKRGNNGVYIWIAKIELVDGSIEYLTGDVTLIGR